MRKAGVLVAISALLVAGAGCGEEVGVASDAVVTAYVEAPLCAGAERALEGQDGRAGAVRVRALCLTSARAGARQDLATIGANARRATEDSTSIAYLELSATPSFSRPIVEAAGIPLIRDNSGEAAMESLLSAIQAAGDVDSLRESVRQELSET